MAETESPKFDPHWIQQFRGSKHSFFHTAGIDLLSDLVVGKNPKHISQMVCKKMVMNRMVEVDSNITFSKHIQAFDHWDFSWTTSDPKICLYQNGLLWVVMMQGFLWMSPLQQVDYFHFFCVWSLKVMFRNPQQGTYKQPKAILLIGFLRGGGDSPNHS